ILLDEIEGIVVSQLRGPLPRLIEKSELLKLAKVSTQFEWGSFYMFSNEQTAKKLFNNMKTTNKSQANFYRKMVSMANVTVRLFDNRSFIIYSNKREVLELIKGLYREVDIGEGTLDQLKFYS
ncbi:hypothetical protein JKY72_07125, partial [Candidatus Gracilibacteria bacterium]|nr:hypothetical protein [Candidatus Gracilibacteria bacterium]